MRRSLFLALVCVFSFVFVLGACSSGGGGSKSGSYQNLIDGKQVEFLAKSNHDNISEGANWIYIVSGETFALVAFFWVQDPEDNKFSSDYTDPELANTVWSIKGNLGYFVSEGNATAIGAATSITITAAGGTTGSISVENGKLKCSYSVKVVATQAELPQD